MFNPALWMQIIITNYPHWNFQFVTDIVFLYIPIVGLITVAIIKTT